MSANPDPRASTAPATGDDLVLTPPAPVGVVQPAQAAAAVKLDPETEARIDQTISGFVRSLESLDVHSADFQKKVDSVSSMGDTEIRQSASVSNRLLDKPV